jgi:hypothetical protein
MLCNQFSDHYPDEFAAQLDRINWVLAKAE